MALCKTCHTKDARATKDECPTCYDWRRRKGTARPEAQVIKHNQRMLERELERKR